MNEHDDKIVEALHAMRNADQDTEAELLRSVAAGERRPDTVEPAEIDDDLATQSLLLELSAPADDNFRAALADRVEAQLHAERQAQAPSNVVFMGAFRRKRAGMIATIAVAAAAAFMVFRAPPPGDDIERGDSLGVFDSATIGYTVEVSKTPKTSRGDDSADATGTGTALDPVVLSVPDSGDVQWVLRPERIGASTVAAKVFVRGPDGTLTPAGDEVRVVVAKTGAVRVSLQLEQAPYVRAGVQVDMVVVVGDADELAGIEDSAGLEVIGVKAPGAKRFIRFLVE